MANSEKLSSANVSSQESPSDLRSQSVPVSDGACTISTTSVFIKPRTPTEDEVEPDSPENLKKIEELKKEFKKKLNTEAHISRVVSVGSKVKFTLLLAALFMVVAAFLAKNQAVQLVGQYGLGLNNSVMSHQHNWKDAGSLAFPSLKKVARLYPNQDEHLWITLASALSSAVSEEPKQPSVVVLLIPADVRPSFASCFARQVGELVHSVFQSVDRSTQYSEFVMTVSPQNFTDGSSISDIHSRLLKYLKTGKVVVVRDVHKVTGEPNLMVFHAFCDNSAAPDKRAIFFYLLPLPADYGKVDRASANEVAAEILHSSWTSLSRDKRPALIARVAVQNVVMKPGDVCDN